MSTTWYSVFASKERQELLFLFAIKSDFGYWLWMPKSKNYYGSTPKNGIAARVEKVRHNGREFRIIGYGSKVGEIHRWYDYNEVMSFFSLYFEPEQKKSYASQTLSTFPTN